MFSRNLLLSLFLILCVFFLRLLLGFFVNHWFWATIMCLVVLCFSSLGLFICVLTILNKFGNFSVNISSSAFFCSDPLFRTPSTYILDHLKVSHSWLFQSWCSGSSFSDSLYSVSFWIVCITVFKFTNVCFFLFWFSCLLILISMSYLGFVFHLLCIPNKFWFNVIHCKFYTVGTWMFLYF